MKQQEINILPYAKAIVALLKGEIYYDNALWHNVVTYKKDINVYLNQIGIKLIVEESEGYAFLKQIKLDDEGSTIGLIKRMPISFEISLVCIFLREELDNFDIGDSQSNICTISHQQLREHIELFFKEKPNMKRFIKEIKNHISGAVKLGFLKIYKDSKNTDEIVYEIKRIIKSKVSVDQIEELKQTLLNYGKNGTV